MYIYIIINKSSIREENSVKFLNKLDFEKYDTYS